MRLAQPISALRRTNRRPGRRSDRRALVRLLAALLFLAVVAVVLTPLARQMRAQLLGPQSYDRLVTLLDRRRASAETMHQDGAVFFPPHLSTASIGSMYEIARGSNGDESNENPYCGLRDVYQRMAWSTSDVRRATVAYYGENVQIVIITGNYDNYTRVEAARCTWLAHVPPERVLFATDRLHVPRSGWGADGPHGIYRYGTWHASEELKMAPVCARVADNGTCASYHTLGNQSVFDNVVKRWGHPPGWVQAQVRFFDGLRFAYEDQRAAWAAMADKSRFKHRRWVALLDDDTYVHLDAMAAVLQSHSMAQLLGHYEYWWRLLLRREGGDVVLDTQVARDWFDAELGRAKGDWEVKCDRMAAEHLAHAEDPLFPRGPFPMAECLQLPHGIVDAVLLLLRATGVTEDKKRLYRTLRETPRRREFVASFATSVGNSLLLQPEGRGELGAPASLASRLWAAAEGLLAPSWVQLYLLHPLHLSKDIKGGQGTYLNAAAFYRRFFGSAGGAHTYAYEVHCLPYLAKGHASDGALKRCLYDMGVTQASEPRFTDRVAAEQLSMGRLLPALPPRVGARAWRVRDLLARLTDPHLFSWASMHVKMEFYDVVRSSREVAPPPETLRTSCAWHLAHARMSAYYESIYRRDALGTLVLARLGAQARSELVESAEHRRHTVRVAREMGLALLKDCAR